MEELVGAEKGISEKESEMVDKQTQDSRASKAEWGALVSDNWISFMVKRFKKLEKKCLSSRTALFCKWKLRLDVIWKDSSVLQMHNYGWWMMLIA